MPVDTEVSNNILRAPEVKFGFTAEQIIEEGRTTQENIVSIRSWIIEQSKLPRLTDEQITLFLICCNNDNERTKLTIESHYRIKNRSPKLFNNRKCSREDLRLQMKTYECGVLPERTDDGCAIIFCRTKDTNYANAILEHSLVLCFMTMEAAFYDHPPNGVIILLDQKGTGLLHLTQLRIGLVKLFLEYIQEGLPMAVKQVHIINTIHFIDKLMALMKPFISKKSYELLVFHPPNMDMELFHKKWVPKRCLPIEYGGDLPSVETLHRENIRKLNEMENYFDAEELQRKNLGQCY